jgi:glutathione S-transferase
MRRLIGLSYSPWSLKARWALDHHRVPYRWREYLPMLGEPLLQARLRRRRVTVPVLIDEAGVHDDSFDIARRAEAVGQGAPLFPDALTDAISRWNQTSEDVCAAGRALTTARVLADPAALAESVPVPPALRRPLRGVATAGARFLTRKYGLREVDEDAALDTIGLALEAVREALADGRAYLEGPLTYADFALAVSLQFVQPVAGTYVHLGPASRRCWTRDGLAQAYPDVLAWRDQVFARHWGR